MSQMQKLSLYPPQIPEEHIYISDQGLQKLKAAMDSSDPYKNNVWTTDYTVELPIRVQKEGEGSLTPLTLNECFEDTVKKYSDLPAFSYKVKGKWESITFKDYFQQCKWFASGLISLGITKQRAVNIIGFNSTEWVIAFMGSVLGFYMPVGVYTTNGPEACHYVAEHSDAEVAVVENKIHLEKYLAIWPRLPLLKYVIVYADKIPDNIPSNYKDKVLLWNDVLQRGKNFKPKIADEDIEIRMKQPKPGNCCTLVYTSGTTGNPKGVMLSHDNYTWTARTSLQKYGLDPLNQERLVSYLPLSHVAAQITDIIGGVVASVHIYFADATALSGSLVEYLKEVRPTFFFSVPRVWEKIEEKMRAMAAQNGAIKTKLATWAKGLGPQGTFDEINQKSLPLSFNIAKKLIFNNIKKALGLDQARFLLFGAAPLSPQIRQYFLSLNMFLINGYGMSECSGPETFSDLRNFEQIDDNCIRSAGRPIDGSQILIHNPDKFQEGEICFRGRNRFMGYYKNEQATRETIDADGFLHSGDMGTLDKNGNLLITGRLKELIITSGGENVAPVLIENNIKEELKFLSNAMVIGDARKYLTVVLTLKHAVDKDGKLIPDQINSDIQPILQGLGVNVKTIKEAISNATLKKIIEQGIEKANKSAISKAQYIQKWILVEGDFTIEGGELTPTLKLKRKVAHQKYQNQIESMYQDAKL